MQGRKDWLKITLWIVALLMVVAGGLSVMSVVMLRRVPEWYQPDLTTASERHTAAGAFAKILIDIHNWGSGANAANVRAAQTVAQSNAQTAGQAQNLLAQKPDQAFQITFTDTQLNAFFNEWADSRGRREWFDQYVDDPRLVLRQNQLIIVGKAKELGLVVSLLFEPRLTDTGQLDLNLSQVLGGILPLPDAMWSGKRDSIERTLQRKLPLYQTGADITKEGIANGDAASAAMNQMLLATLKYKPASPVIFVPIDLKGLSESLPVKITTVDVHDHALELTVEQMNGEERNGFLEELKKPIE